MKDDMKSANFVEKMHDSMHEQQVRGEQAARKSFQDAKSAIGGKREQGCRNCAGENEAIVDGGHATKDEFAETACAQPHQPSGYHEQ